MSIQAVFKRIHHFATVDCNMPLETRLKCIAKECEASLRNENACPPEGTRVIQCPHCLISWSTARKDKTTLANVVESSGGFAGCMKSR